MGSLGNGVYGTLTCKSDVPGKFIGRHAKSPVAVGGSVYTVLSSEGGNVVTLAGDLPGVVTSFAGEQVTILTSVVGGSLPTK